MAGVLPPAFVAVTTHRIVEPTSATASTYVLPVAEAMFAQFAPPESHRRHWYVYDVASGDHVPVSTVSVNPCVFVPAIAGSTWFTGPVGSGGGNTGLWRGWRVDDTAQGPDAVRQIPSRGSPVDAHWAGTIGFGIGNAVNCWNIPIVLPSYAVTVLIP